jgi:FKBP-type peptidyl-prolyl cis-trans isomerase
MLRSWAQQISAWFDRKGAHSARRHVRARRRIHGRRRSAVTPQLEILESRQLLTSLVAVHVNGNSISLSELRGGSTSSEIDFSVSYTSSQVVLTATGDTEFRVSGQTEATDTINITGPASLKMQLNQHVNDVSISGDGTDNLSSLNLHLGAGKQDNTLTLTSVLADSATIHGERSNDSVTLDQSTVSGNLNANIGTSSGDTLDLESTTVSGNLSDHVGQLTMDQSTVTGRTNNTEPGKDSTLTTTDSTYSGDVSIRMGKSGVVNLDSSDSGSNEFQSSVLIAGAPNHETTVNEAQGSTDFAVTPTYRHATVTNTSPTPPPTPPTLGTPTVNSQTITSDAAPVITGTYDAVNTTVLTVTANGSTYTLGSSSQLTAPSSGQWSLNLNSATLTSPVSTVTVTSADKAGDTTSGTGTITDAQGIINEYLTANNLTATKTADGLNYVITTNGTGAVPTAGESVTVNYSGFLLNTNGTLGTEFDSNTNSAFGHVTPFSFTLGAGQVIAGWDEAFALLPVGTVATLIIPPSLGYGSAGSGSTIPPNSILVFDVTLVSAT